jgi:hypothetical protein
MANLFWKTNKETKVLLDRPFKTEEEFERTVFETSELLEDIFLLKRQVRGGGKPGIPDIVGIDAAGNVCIIELKNTEVDADIIPQVLKYAIWAETSPDSVRSLWLECENKPENLKLSQVPEVRVLVIAPTILRSTLAVVNKINYKVDLIEVKRWVEGVGAGIAGRGYGQAADRPNGASAGLGRSGLRRGADPTKAGSRGAEGIRLHPADRAFSGAERNSAR